MYTARARVAELGTILVVVVDEEYEGDDNVANTGAVDQGAAVSVTNDDGGDNDLTVLFCGVVIAGNTGDDGVAVERILTEVWPGAELSLLSPLANGVAGAVADGND